MGGELAGIDRGAKTLPQVAHRADVVFVCVRDQDRFDPVFARLKPCHIRHDQVHARRGVHVGESDTKVHNDQAFLFRCAVTIDIGVHANLTCPTKGQID